MEPSVNPCEMDYVRHGLRLGKSEGFRETLPKPHGIEPRRNCMTAYFGSPAFRSLQEFPACLAAKPNMNLEL